MGTRNPDRLSAVEWRKIAPTVRHMTQGHWRVLSICRDCKLALSVNLVLVARVAGEDLSLWNRTNPCKRHGCRGVCDFHGEPPRLGRYVLLAAEWPG
jgi:hypothetical protein